VSELDAERLLTTLSGDLALLRGRIEALEAGELPARIDQLADRMETVTKAVQALTDAAQPAKIHVWDWTRLNAEEAGDAWKELLDWMRTWLVPRGGLQATVRVGWKPCWFLHPSAVEDMSVLYACWRHAYQDPKAAPTRAAEWWDRWLPHTLQRITTATNDCQHPYRPDDGHRDTSGLPGPLTDDEQLSAFIATDQASRPPAPPKQASTKQKKAAAN
jgi:hypothetical protein